MSKTNAAFVVAKNVIVERGYHGRVVLGLRFEAVRVAKTAAGAFDGLYGLVWNDEEPKLFETFEEADAVAHRYNNPADDYVRSRWDSAAGWWVGVEEPSFSHDHDREDFHAD